MLFSASHHSMIRKKPVLDLIRDGTRFSDKIMRQFI